VTCGAANGYVFERQTGRTTPQQQATTAHIAPPHKFPWKGESLAEHFEQWLDIFWSCDAAEQDDIAVSFQESFELIRIAIDMPAILVIPVIDNRRRNSL